MESTISTPRLRLTLVKKAERGSQEFQWLHTLYSDEKATFWNIGGMTKSTQETEAKLKRILPSERDPENSYKITYAVHQVLAPRANSNDPQMSFVGTINLKSVTAGGLALPPHLTLPAARDPTTLTVEIAYFFLSSAWGQGFATESVRALLDECQRSTKTWTTFNHLFVRAIVNPKNAPSQRVVQKLGMEHLGDFEWTGEAVFVAGEWREKDSIQIWGKMLDLTRK